MDIEKALQEYKREVVTLCKLKHPNLVLFMGVVKDAAQKNLCIVTEFCFGGSLFSALHQQPNVDISWKQKIQMAFDTAKGMNYLHTQFESPILHRDLKSLK